MNVPSFPRNHFKRRPTRMSQNLRNCLAERERQQTSSTAQQQHRRLLSQTFSMNTIGHMHVRNSTGTITLSLNGPSSQARGPDHPSLATGLLPMLRIHRLPLKPCSLARCSTPQNNMSVLSRRSGLAISPMTKSSSGSKTNTTLSETFCTISIEAANGLKSVLNFVFIVIREFMFRVIDATREGVFIASTACRRCI
ncbi:hypothetical protein BDN70DRAFT_416636 [Pholiota conissans]|uniref:Uncharacterized protein n=1 Tax=Pholiota conissans TaxID=109636 RepID=A0A9P5Z8F4_9AGAR|nr:hypothetical protein BDN70DRAFT_416636 [Pholiota conissans]